MVTSHDALVTSHTLLQAYMVTSHDNTSNKPAWLQASVTATSLYDYKPYTLVTSQGGYKLVFTATVQAYTVTSHDTLVTSQRGYKLVSLCLLYTSDAADE